MNQAERPESTPQNRGDRLARLSRAGARVTDTLELDAVLPGVVEGNRSLTGARYGAVTVLDGSGKAAAVVTSSLTPAERRRLELSGGLALFELLSGLPEPLRLTDFAGCVPDLGLHELGLPLDPVGAFLVASIRHLGRRVATSS